MATKRIADARVPHLMKADDVSFLRKAALAIALLAALALAWWLREVLLLVFAAIVGSILLRALAAPLETKFQWPHPVALAVVVLGVAAALSLVILVFGVQMQAQVVQAAELLPKAYETLVAWIRQQSWGDDVIAALSNLDLEAAAPALIPLPSYVLALVNGVANFVLVIAGSIYLAAQPNLYRRELLFLFPVGSRNRIASTMDDIAGELRGWLVSQFAAMAAVGVLVGLAMWTLGVPSPFALALFAGLMEFVPIAGPVASAVPALLLALLQSPTLAGWTLLAFILIQAVEGNLLIPLLQQKIIEIPPVVTLFGLIVFGAIFGALGIVLAAPLSVVLLVVVKTLESDKR